ncbi:MAG: SDR family oxidoreductase [Candidatus Omnitrophica bacterium]|nr:SDR family oxidoreductase [Candidatus Omnitrophota bacterium]MBI2173844.1 SDR family oxidoreductase [Candidatus Omnitrophota bacterium]MBI3009421.1 SDR family oxidoreductase [Candidatus Omnitrophota bacterium]
MTQGTLTGKWALILGASSGFGAATARELSKNGMNIIGVHLDRKAAMAEVEKLIAELRSGGGQALYFNVNAADPVKRQEVLDQVQPKLEGKPITVLLHSLAFGTLKPYLAADPKDQLTKDQIEMTLDVMANSLIYWVQDLVGRKIIGHGSRIFAMTSSGGARVWPNYGAVSAAKAALESHIRQLAMELAAFGATANSIRAGVTDTPALRKIPGNDQMMEYAKLRNPYHRLTTTQDVAKAICALANSGTDWVTGNVIGTDGGEDIIG